MKKIQLEVQTVGTDDFVAQGAIRAKVNGKFVEPNILAIVNEAIELQNNVRITLYHQTVDYLEFKVITSNGNYKLFKIKGSRVTSNSALKIRNTVTSDEIDEYMKYVVSIIKDIEEWVYEVHKTTKNTLLEYK